MNVFENRLFQRQRLFERGITVPAQASEYAGFDELTDLLEQFLAEGDAEERGEIAVLLERVLGYGDLEMVAEAEESSDLHWVDARVSGKRRVSILLVAPERRIFDRGYAGAGEEELARRLAAHLDCDDIPWGILSDGLRWRIISSESLIPEHETLEVDLFPLIEAADEPALMAGMSLLSAEAATEGGIWDEWLQREHRHRRSERRLWADLTAAAGNDLVPVALWAEWAGLIEGRPLLKILTRKGEPGETALQRALAKSLRALPAPLPESRPHTSSGWHESAKKLLRALPVGPDAATALRSLALLAGGIEEHLGGRKNGSSPGCRTWRELSRKVSGAESSPRVLFASLPSLDVALETVLAFSLDRYRAGAEDLGAAVRDSVGGVFAVDFESDRLAVLERLLVLACRVCGAEPPYLGHRLRAGNPWLSVAVSSLGSAPSGKRRRPESGGPRQLSFVELMFLDRLHTLGSDLALLSAAGPERTGLAARHEGIFRRLLRGVDRFRDLADLWLLMHGAGETRPDAPTYEAFVANLKESDAAWGERLKPWRSELESLRERRAPFHWELEFPELYVEGGSPRVDPGFHLIVLGSPPASAKRELRDLRSYHRELTGDSKGGVVTALTRFAGMVRTSTGALVAGPLSAGDARLLATSEERARSLGEGEKAAGRWLVLRR